MFRYLIFSILLFFFIFNSYSEEKKTFLMLKNNTVNVRYGPGFDYPIKYIYKKKFLPVKVIDKKEDNAETKAGCRTSRPGQDH